MNPQAQVQQIFEDLISLKQGCDEYIVKMWDFKKEMYVNTKIKIEITQNNMIIYSQNGVILRIEQTNDVSKNLEILKNIEQIKYLTWQGQSGQNNKKNGKWVATWKGEDIMNVGGYFMDGLKQGLWIQMIKNYWDQAQVFEIGEYENYIRRNRWNYIYDNKKINGGSYNVNGQKYGKWFEFCEGFREDCQVLYFGEYDENGQKVGIWDTMRRRSSSDSFQLIGGGIYDQKGNSRKIGRWIELSELFRWDTQVIFNGEYDMNGVKVGLWEILYKQTKKKFFEKIGGGVYDQKENSRKIGRWIELSESFRCDSQVTYNGEYNKNGNKIGRWDIYLNWNGGNNRIGGGLYEDQKGVQIKVGRWIELFENFNEQNQIKYNGIYNQQGNKIGRWDIFQRENRQKKFCKIGGGEYDGSFKIGKWIEIWDDFEWNKQLIYNGEYNLDGKKIGRWDILEVITSQVSLCGCINYDSIGEEIYRSINDPIIFVGQFKDEKKIGKWDIMSRQYQGRPFQNIGGGEYDGLNKIGKWIELQDDINQHLQFIYKGEYNMGGYKIGRWDILERVNNQFSLCGCINYDSSGNEIYRNDKDSLVFVGQFKDEKKFGKWDFMYKQQKGQPFEIIGGGEYDGLYKIGKWIELWDNFRYDSQITFIGNYNENGQKIGKWDIFQKHNGQVQQIGGGSYDVQKGSSIKIGRWIDVSHSFRQSNKIKYNGDYNNNGHKIGKWDIIYSGAQEKEYKLIGGGFYDESSEVSTKIGDWIEVSEEYQKHKEITDHGKYDKNTKVGRWDIEFKGNKIAGGSYEVYEGVSKKIGKWIELSEGFNEVLQITFHGEYDLNEKKVGRWDRELKGKKIGGGSYDVQEGVSKKVGKWTELPDGFYQITFVGEYNQNGQKVGIWDTEYYGQKIGGGQYVLQEGSSIKFGKWIELSNEFYANSQIIYCGEYNLKGQKDGKWDIMYCKYNEKEFKKIGGGSYNECKEGSKKIGSWIELIDGFGWNGKITYKGEYNEFGEKIGIWVEIDSEKNKVKELRYNN
ncbi:unnamed protein product [Paramecium sonneborni]|uniref:Uncharacterized protein n=1 Tax=Paramecium sonneborni TaxID=65129 RepID=A0A8S1LK12_9CILI|nr:unnamed protein product [Paramecium sonneborni]